MSRRGKIVSALGGMVVGYLAVTLAWELSWREAHRQALGGQFSDGPVHHR